MTIIEKLTKLDDIPLLIGIGLAIAGGILLSVPNYSVDDPNEIIPYVFYGLVMFIVAIWMFVTSQINELKQRIKAVEEME